MMMRSLYVLIVLCCIQVNAMDDHDSTHVQVSSSYSSTASMDRSETTRSRDSDDSGTDSEYSSLASSGEFSSIDSDDVLKIKRVSDRYIELEKSLSKLSLEDGSTTERLQIKDGMRRYGSQKNYLTKIKPHPIKRFSYNVERLLDERISHVRMGCEPKRDTGILECVQMQEATISRLVKLARLQMKVNDHLSQQLADLMGQVEHLRQSAQPIDLPVSEPAVDTEPEWCTEPDMCL